MNILMMLTLKIEEEDKISSFKKPN